VKPVIANSLWFASCLPEAAAFWRATRDVAGTQRRVLRRITGFESVAEFRERVPLSDEPGTPREPVIRRVPTSGTTGPTKWIPYTRSLLAEFQRGIAPWVVDLFRHNPSMLAGRSYWAISPVAGEAEGFGDDTEYLGNAGWLARATQAVPATVRHVRDIDRWRRETVRHLVGCRDLTFISVWHPSFLTLLLEGVEKPSGLWPKLRLISCWADAAAAKPARELARLFPQATIQPKGLIATEGFVSLPLCERDGAPLAVRSHFFEFLDDAGQAKLAHELGRGREYSVVLTTSGGLLRYRLHDRVRVTGFENECPLLRFIGKENNVSDHFGEKLNELHVQAALESIRLDASFAMMACDGNAYTLFVQAVESDERLLMVAERLDAVLQANIHYRFSRQLGQLEPARVFRIAGRGREVYLEECRRRGQRLGEAKPSVLRADTGWSRVFPGGFLNPSQLSGLASGTGP
jgi:hypothetical protein